MRSILLAIPLVLVGLPVQAYEPPCKQGLQDVAMMIDTAPVSARQRSKAWELTEQSAELCARGLGRQSQKLNAAARGLLATENGEAIRPSDSTPRGAPQSAERR